MISDDVRQKLQQALETDVRNYLLVPLIERHQALHEAVSRVLAHDEAQRLVQGCMCDQDMIAESDEIMARLQESRNAIYRKIHIDR